MAENLRVNPDTSVRDEANIQRAVHFVSGESLWIDWRGGTSLPRCLWEKTALTGSQSVTCSLYWGKRVSWRRSLTAPSNTGFRVGRCKSLSVNVRKCEETFGPCHRDSITGGGFPTQGWSDEGAVDVKTALAQLDGCMVAMGERHRRSHGC